MTNPYSPPSTKCDITNSPKNANSRKLALPGVIFLVGPLMGVAGTAIGLIRAFGQLKSGTSDPGRLAAEISIALMSLVYGAAVGLLGVVLVSIALYNGSNREPWFLKSVCILAPAWCFVLFPYGVIISIYLYTIFLGRKSEFKHDFSN